MQSLADLGLVPEQRVLGDAHQGLDFVHIDVFLIFALNLLVATFLPL